MFRFSAASCSFLLASFAAGGAAAHIDMRVPRARYPIEENPRANKSCPCGVGGSNRTCDVEADGTDLNRSQRVTVLERGATIQVEFDEYIGHAGRYRVAFDEDGADYADFNDNILVDIPDPAGARGNVEDSFWSIDVTLPDMTCDNCTLQLIQAMHGDTANPVVETADLSSYYVCADIRLVEPGTVDQVIAQMQEDGVLVGNGRLYDDEEGDSDPEEQPMDMVGARDTLSMESSDSGGGCALGSVSTPVRPWALVGGLAALGWAARRRRRR